MMDMSASKLFQVLLILSVSIFPIFAFMPLASSSEDIAVLAINRAEEVVALAYQSVLEAEMAGADVSGLLTRLNVAGELLAEARISYRLENFDGAVGSANRCYEEGEEVRVDADRLRDLAVEDGRQRFLWTMLWSILGVVTILCLSFLGWRVFKRRYYRRVLGMRPEVGSDNEA